VSRVYERLARRALFATGSGDPEAAHARVLRALAGISDSPGARALLHRVPRVAAPVTAFGLKFPNPVGLAAGMDKDAVALPAWAALGFGFVEVGTVTWHAQAGNPRPRLYRLTASEAIINRMGFNNTGAEAMAARLERLGRLPIPVGISLGKSKITSMADATDDYLSSLKVLLPFADYVAVNVSSPNTPGLRSLQDRSALDELLHELRAHTVATAGSEGPQCASSDSWPSGGLRHADGSVHPQCGSSDSWPSGGLRHADGSVHPKPLLVKIAPDLADQAVREVLAVCAARGVAGIIATNTTIDRAGLAPADAARAAESGGLSGRPLRDRALEVVRLVVGEAGGALPVIGVGGISSADDATRMLDAGAVLVQLYTGLVYHGPGLVHAIAREAAARTGGRPG
jgi:dihydroorotate dehydrogenase